MQFAILSIHFKTNYWEVYLIDKNQNFSSGLIKFKGKYYVKKKIQKKLEQSKKANCKDYSKGEEFKCNSRLNCLDKCINKRFLQQYSKITANSVIEKDELKPYLLNFIKFDEFRDKKIESYCMNLTKSKDCNEVYFEESVQPIFLNLNIIEINLDYGVIVELEYKPSYVKTVLDILNLESIFFGTNVSVILITISTTLKQIFKFKWYKANKILIFLLCLTGFLLHNYQIIDSIIREDLIENGYFIKLDKYRLPGLVFCFELDEKEIDKNFRLSGTHLDRLNNIDHFRKIVYYNRTHFNTFNLNKTSNLNINSEISLHHFYNSGSKCFEVNINQFFKEEDSFFLDNKNFIEVYFNHYPIEKYTLFFYKHLKSNEFGGNMYYNIGYRNKSGDSFTREFQTLVIEREDRFEALKNQ